MAFDAHFEDGERFRYGALVIGGSGLTRYGEFCAVFEDGVSSDHPKVAYLGGDSLETYVSEDEHIKEDDVRGDCAPHSHRQHLAALKHDEEILARGQDEWPALLCSNADNEYVEAVFTAEVTPEHLEAVRLPETAYYCYFCENPIAESCGRLTAAKSDAVAQNHQPGVFTGEDFDHIARPGHACGRGQRRERRAAIPGLRGGPVAAGSHMNSSAKARAGHGHSQDVQTEGHCLAFEDNHEKHYICPIANEQGALASGRKIGRPESMPAPAMARLPVDGMEPRRRPCRRRAGGAE